MKIVSRRQIRLLDTAWYPLAMSMEGPGPSRQEKSVESIPSRDHVLAQISNYCENPHAKVNREKSDDKGIYFLEVQTEDKNGDMVLYEYKRKGTFPDQNVSGETVINVIYFEGTMPVGGDCLATYNPKTEKWE